MRIPETLRTPGLNSIAQHAKDGKDSYRTSLNKTPSRQHEAGVIHLQRGRRGDRFTSLQFPISVTGQHEKKNVHSPGLVFVH